MKLCSGRSALSNTQEGPVIIVIRAVTQADAPVWEAMRCALWPGDDASHAAEIASFFAGTLEEPVAVLVAENADGAIAGFVELSIRFDIVSLSQKRVAYIEGLYVTPAERGRGVTRRLLRAARRWAGEQACTAFASDRADRVIIDRSFKAD